MSLCIDDSLVCRYFMFIYSPKFKTLVKFQTLDKCKNKSKQYTTKVTSRDRVSQCRLRWRVCDSIVSVRIYGSQEMKAYFILTFYSWLGSWYIAVWVITGLLTGYPLNPSSIRDTVKTLYFDKATRPIVGSKVHLIQWAPGVKPLWRGANHSSSLTL